jgi:hypothetical protein
MRCHIPVAAVALLSCVVPQAGAFPAASIVQDLVAAQSLVPLLQGVRERIGPRIEVAPGTLPPSPITGRNSTLFAVRIGVRSRQVNEAVVQAMDRLLRWKPDQPLATEDQELVARWLDALSVKVVGRLVAAGSAVTCDRVCVVQRLTSPDTVFGATAKEQQEARDDILLEALIEAMNERAQGATCSLAAFRLLAAVQMSHPVVQPTPAMAPSGISAMRNHIVMLIV